MQRIEDRYKFVVTGEVLRCGTPKVNVGDPLLARMPIGCLNGGWMQIEPVELTLRKRLRHDEGGSTMPASDVRYANPRLEPFLDTIKGGYPLG